MFSFPHSPPNTSNHAPAEAGTIQRGLDRCRGLAEPEPSSPRGGALNQGRGRKGSSIADQSRGWSCCLQERSPLPLQPPARPGQGEERGTTTGTTAGITTGITTGMAAEPQSLAQHLSGDSFLCLSRENLLTHEAFVAHKRISFHFQAAAWLLLPLPFLPGGSKSQMQRLNP